MTIHPARTMPFDDLASSLREAVSVGAVSEKRCAERPALALYCYTNRAVFDKLWTPTVEMARGLVLDHEARRVIATPFPKFFNHGERAGVLPDEPFDVFEKLDGSLGVIFHDGERWRVTTKGAFGAAQSAWATDYLASVGAWSALTRGATYLAEIVYAANRIVVGYAWEGLALLGAYHEDGREFSRSEVWDVAHATRLRLCEHYTYASVAEMIDAAKAFRADREGFVVRFASGLRVKVKGAEYLRVHRLVSRVTPLALWESLAANDDLDAIRREIPEEFWGDFDAIREALTARFVEVVDAVEHEAGRWEGRSNKDIGLALSTIEEPARSLLFAYRKGGDAWLSNARDRMNVCKRFRPDGNVLAGYVQGAALSRVTEDA